MSKVIKILGTGCRKCQQTEIFVREILAKHNIEATVEKIEDIAVIMQYNVISTPAVVVDESIKIKGKVPSEKELLNALQ